MPRLINTKTGDLEFVGADAAASGLDSGEYRWPDDTPVVSLGGAPRTLSPEELPRAAGLGYREATPKELHEADIERAYGDQPITSFLEGAAGTLVPGGTSILKAYHGGSQGMAKRAESLAGDVGKYGAMFAPFGAPGAIMKGGRAIGGMSGLAAEAAGMELLSSLAEEGLSNDPLNVERIMTNVTTAGLVGFGVGGVGKLISKGTSAAKELTGRLLSKGTPLETAVGVEASAAKEIAALKAAAPRAADLADEVNLVRNDFRRLIGNKKDGYGAVTRMPLNASVKGIRLTTAEQYEIAQKTLRSFGNIVDKPDTLMKSPGKALDALELQRKYLNNIIENQGHIRLNLAAEGHGPSPTNLKGGVRWQLLDSGELEKMLERNTALTNRISEFETIPSKIKDIEKATASKVRELNKEETIAGFKGGGLLKRLAQSFVFGGVANTLAPALGGRAAIVGGWAASHITRDALGKLGGKLGDGAAHAAAMANAAVKGLVSAAKYTAPKAVPLALKTLRERTMAPPAEGEGIPLPKAKNASRDELRALYDKRMNEVKGQVTLDPMTGMAVMRPDARNKIGDALTGVRTIDPQLADRMETVAARKIEFLAAKAPKNPGMPGWEASKGDIAKWARYLEATENPNGVFERMANGTMTPEDVETVKTVYPELHNDLTQQILIQVAKIGGPKKLPYWKRLMMTMFTGSMLDPSLSPNVVAALQATYANEPGTEGGTQAPGAQPNFGAMGSTKKGEDTEATKAQELSS